ncbi:MAG: glycosyltransferase [Chloroflexi bacterium CFX4]|nr:glycosyltransferase [Chloroflexi bacterium CFX4]MDL1920996.1 WecB/TagA/CpsF family glycosyltransferase [Chloroflexi bacterium CFX3]
MVTPERPQRVNILGVGVSAVNMPQALAIIDGWLAARLPRYVCVSNVHSIMSCQADAELRAIHNAAGMVTPDGMPLVWLSRRSGYRHVARVYGPDLLLALCEHGLRHGYRHYFYGGAEGVAARLAAQLTARFDGLQVAGTYAPPFSALSPAEDAQITAQIAASGAHIVWVGLGMPKQERWMAAHTARLPQVLIGVGAAFDFHSGMKRQAPRWMQQRGLEWLFRLTSEPRRLWRRYLTTIPPFVVLAAAQQLGWRRYHLTD